jgi:hypothetical protein
MSPTLWSKLFVVVAGTILLSFGVVFRRRQKGGAMGGAISLPKAIWLPLAIFEWFVFCVAVGFDPALPPALRCPFAAVGASMWLRGAVEMVMLYGTKSWRPPMGIAHDLITLALLGVIVVVNHDAVAAGAVGEQANALSQMAVAMLPVVAISLVVEVVHAWTFYGVVGRGTTGDEGIWFADDTDPRFIAINRRTWVGNAMVGVPTLVASVVWLMA